MAYLRQILHLIHLTCFSFILGNMINEFFFGKTKFGFSRLIRGFLDLLTVVFTTRYLKRPMHFFGLLGTISMLAGAIIFGILCVQWIIGTTYLAGRPLAWFSVALVIIGVQLFSTGLIGELLVKQSFEKTKEYNIERKLFLPSQK